MDFVRNIVFSKESITFFKKNETFSYHIFTVDDTLKAKKLLLKAENETIL